jgi:hypothetical protein
MSGRHQWCETGIWTEVRPHQLRGSAHKHTWIFAYYFETPSERSDDCWYQAFLFRNEARTRFGVLETVERRLSRLNARRLATKVVQDEEYRTTLLSDDPRLRALWKRR